MYFCLLSVLFRAIFSVKPFPRNLPITVAMFQNAVNLPDELIKV